MKLKCFFLYLEIWTWLIWSSTSWRVWKLPRLQLCNMVEQQMFISFTTQLIEYFFLFLLCSVCHVSSISTSFSIRRLYWLLIQTLQDKFTVGKKKYINSSFWKRKNFENIRHRQMLSGPLNAFAKFRVYQHICPFRIESQSFCFHMSFDFIAD